MSRFFERVARGLRKPPGYIVRRAALEVRGQVERYVAPWREKLFSTAKLARSHGYRDIDALWKTLASRPALSSSALDADELERLVPGERARIVAAAERATRHEVELLGSGPVALGASIDWHCDYKTGHRWPPQYCRDIEYNNPELPSDVKFPWEVSRMQWMIPLGQAYQLSREERYSTTARDLVDHWIENNPYAGSVNWACTMDVALRMITWTYLFHAFADSAAWRVPAFRERFLKALYLHGAFTARNLEHSDINGNHYTADAAGLVIGGLFFGELGEASSWVERGWTILESEIQLQVFPDGVDFEASIPYHRLVQELFLFPAILRQRCGLTVSPRYVERLVAMASFTAAYSRVDGSVPLWGDADDARTLPFGDQPLNDHRYLLALTGLQFAHAELVERFSGSVSEVAWLFGTQCAEKLPKRPRAETSMQFPHGGFFVLRHGSDHVFIDCGPVGLGGRGGHGHNDLLSFEAALDGIHLVTDCGAYLYTADYAERNRFRSTAYHNTPQIDGQEINRFVRPDDLWHLHADARYEIAIADAHRFAASHTGYQRLADPVTVSREIELRDGTLEIKDALRARDAHVARVPLHLAAGIEAELLDARSFRLRARSGATFVCAWSSEDAWEASMEPARVSPTYGRLQTTVCLVWTLRWQGAATLRVALSPDPTCEAPR